jgi:hypothetical protein
MSGCKINHFDIINLRPLIHSKLSYLARHSDANPRIDAHPSNHNDIVRLCCVK